MAEIQTVVTLELNDSQLKKDIRESMDNISKDIEKNAKLQGKGFGRGFTEGFKPLVSQIAGIIAGIGFYELGKNALLLNDQLVLAEKNYARLLGSAEAANERIREIIELARKTPFRQEELIKADTILQGFGIRTKERFQALIDASAATSNNVAELALIMGQLSQSKSLENINQLLERGIITRNELLNAGITFDKNGAIVNSVDETFTKVSNIIQNKFTGASTAASTTLTGQLSTALDTVNIALGQLAQQTGAYDTLTNIVTKFNELADLSPNLTNSIVGLAVAVGLLTTSLLVLGGPATLIIAGLGVIIASVAEAWNNNTGGIRDNAKKLGEQVERVFGSMGIKTQDFSKIFSIVTATIGVLGGIIGNTFINILSFALNMIEGVKNVFDGVLKFFRGDFRGGLKDIFAGLARIIVNPFDFAAKTIVDILNSLIDGFNKVNPMGKISNIPRPDIQGTISSYIQNFKTGGFPMGKNAIVRVNEEGQEYIANARATNALAAFFQEVGKDFGVNNIDNSDNRSYTQINYGGITSGYFTPPYSIR